MRMIPVSQYLLMFIIMSFLTLSRTQSTTPVSNSIVTTQTTSILKSTTMHTSAGRAQTTAEPQIAFNVTVAVTPVTVSPPVDPCYNYKVLDDPWRATSNQYTFNLKCDTDVNWVGWYRLFIYNQSVQMPDTCVDRLSCGTHAPLWLSGGHPRVEDGVVTRDVCGNWNNNCCYFSSSPIRVKACPGNYYVYELVRPPVCYLAYCADVRNITNITVPAETISTEAPTVDPCYNYTTLDDPWRSPNNTFSSYCDTTVTWAGWYRLFIQGQKAQMPETCVPQQRCGTNAPLWLNGEHPKVEDGVVTRHVCGNWNNNCCQFQFYPMKVKACPGNYYVYEFKSPFFCYLAYCAEVTSYTPAPATNSTGTVIGLQLRATTILDLTQNGNIQIFLDKFKQELISRGLPNTFELKLRRAEKIKP